MSANWRSASANCCGSPIAPNGPTAPPPGSPGPPPPGPPDPPPLSSGLSGMPKPNGRSAIVGSAAGWKGHDSHVISEEAHCDKRAAAGQGGTGGRGAPPCAAGYGGVVPPGSRAQQHTGSAY